MTLKLPRLTWGLLGIAILLTGGVVWLESRRAVNEPDTELAASQETRHFTFTAAEGQSIAIRQGNTFIKLYRSGADPQQWQMDFPQPTRVSQPAVEFLLTALVNSKNTRDFTAPSDQLSEYGLAPSQAELTIQLVNGSTHNLQLGNPDFRGESLYALIDRSEDSAEEIPIYLVPRSLADLAQRAPADWQATAPTEETATPGANLSAPTPPSDSPSAP